MPEDRNRREVTHYLRLSIISEQDGDKRKTSVSIDPEDIIAAGAVLVALLLGGGVVFGSVPLNKYTVAIVGFSGAGAIVAEIVKARKSKATRFAWHTWIFVVVLLAAFGIYVWASWGWVTAAIK
jgi:hypothetical protein